MGDIVRGAITGGLIALLILCWWAAISIAWLPSPACRDGYIPIDSRAGYACIPGHRPHPPRATP